MLHLSQQIHEVNKTGRKVMRKLRSLTPSVNNI